MNVFIYATEAGTGRRTWIRVAAATSIREGELTVVDAGQRQAVLTRLGEEICAVDAECPHRATPLGSGRVVDGAIRCPMHGYEFDLRTGKGVGNDLTLETLKVRLNDE